MSYAAFFECLSASPQTTGYKPFPFQQRMATSPWPDFLDVPTGLGKTLAVVSAWLWKRQRGDADTPSRLVYCLPMRTLVDQTAGVARSCAAVAAEIAGSSAVPVHVMRGGAIDDDWVLQPERECIIVGTQDQLLSRALNRGYGVTRFAWPQHFAWLNDDAMWVLDETQLMGVGVTTAAQLQGMRDKLGTFSPTRTLWVSATLDPRAMETVDNPLPNEGWHAERLSAEDRAHPLVQQRIGAVKHLAQLSIPALEKEADKKEVEAFGLAITDAHQEGTRTLVICNRVSRAQAVYSALLKQGRTPDNLGLIHSRFMPEDRARANSTLQRAGDQIVVATQAIEAGVDVSSATLITELAPWPSIVQRVGRCNRSGELSQAKVLWVDLHLDKKNAVVPYEPADLEHARARLMSLDKIGPAALAEATLPDALASAELTLAARRRLGRPTLRRRDLLELFDTTPDLTGNDLDVSRFIRDGDDTDVELGWADFDTINDVEPTLAFETCRVSISQAKKFVVALAKKAKANKGQGAYQWNALDGEWRAASERGLRPGQRLLCARSAGGYDAAIGWTGLVGKGSVCTVPVENAHATAESAAAAADTLGSNGVAYEGDPLSYRPGSVALTCHLDDVVAATEALVQALPRLGDHGVTLMTAARWHDVGKAHPAFQDMLLRASNAQPAGVLIAKGVGGGKASSSRRYYRHELASALAYRQQAEPSAERDLVSYLVAAHHGKVRGSIRALPNEPEPSGDQRGAMFARGVWDGDELPEIRWPNGETLGPFTLSLSPMRMGGDSWMSAYTALLHADALGPFRLAILEATLRIADVRASISPSQTITLQPAQEAS